MSARAHESTDDAAYAALTSLGSRYTSPDALHSDASYDGERGAPFVVWRAELWHYIKLYGTWRREDDPKVLRRFMIDRTDFSRWTWNFEPGLGGIDLGRAETRRIEFELPEGFTAAKGRLNGLGGPATDEGGGGE